MAPKTYVVCAANDRRKKLLLISTLTESVNTLWPIRRPPDSSGPFAELKSSLSSRCSREIHAGGLIRNRLSADVLRPNWRFTGCEWWNSVPVSSSRTGLNHYANSCSAGWCHGSGWEGEWESTFSFSNLCGNLMDLDVSPWRTTARMLKWSAAFIVKVYSWLLIFTSVLIRLFFPPLSLGWGFFVLLVLLSKHEIQMTVCQGKTEREILCAILLFCSIIITNLEYYYTLITRTVKMRRLTHRDFKLSLLKQ